MQKSWNCIFVGTLFTPHQVDKLTHFSYSKTSVKWPLKIRQNKDLNKKCSLMKVESIAECSCNTFDLHYAIISIETQFLVILRVAVLHRFYCM